jgi:hypothetical protein
MSYSIFLGQYLGIGLIVMSLAFLLNTKHHEKACNEVAENSTFWILVSSIMFFVGMLLVFTHNLWVLDWRALITLIGWMLLVSGILRLCFQTRMMSWCKKINMKKIPHRVTWITLILGAILLYASIYS